MAELEVIDDGREFPEALRRCFEGFPIRRKGWAPGMALIRLDKEPWGGLVNSPALWFTIDFSLRAKWYAHLAQTDLLATDWQILDKPKKAS
jgi:hypothetical protein